MEESECIVCFSQYDEDDYRSRVMPCGHTMCRKCLMRAIKENLKKCPKCRAHYTASNVNDLPVNFSLEGIVKSINSSEKITECPEHQLPLTKRCSIHKAWLCQHCLKEDHSSVSCKIITISEHLNVKISTQLDQSQPLLNEFEKSCKKSDDYKKHFKKQMEQDGEEIIRYEAVIERLQKEVKRKKVSKNMKEEYYRIFDQKLENLINKRSSYDESVISLKSSETIRGVSRFSVAVQNEAEKLKLVSREIENEVDLRMQAFKLTSNPSIEHFLGNHRLTVKDGRYHLHAIQGKKKVKAPPYNLQFSDADENDPPLTDGILTFMDIALPNQKPQRVYMKMVGNTARARQHLLLVTGQCGVSYRDLQFFDPCNEGQPGEFLIIRPYDGNQAAPLVKHVSISNDIARENKVGLMTGAGWNNNTDNALFGVILSDEPGHFAGSCFGQVTSGIEILIDVAKSKELDMIKVVDCGVILFW